MHTLIKPAMLIAALAAVVPSATLSNPAGSPFNGTWELNAAASKFGSHPAKSETRTYDVTGNKITLTSSGMNVDGTRLAYHYTGAFDGKWYPMTGNPMADTISLQLVNARSITATVKKGSAVSGMSEVVVSPDGKHLTFTRTYPGGKLAPDVSVYDRR